ncbi:lysozyme [Candidatus Solirubrobacter pratensis]|uniref:lysozyme n=1 Tax=Candidatus Solirubrobacter pratensis TaxID=1298857 RepID=UPI00042066C5|nr:lysozyme [Candidatus Solirubrobacter pratensis]
MTVTELQHSLALWEERESRFHKNWRDYVKKNSKSPRRAYWYGMYKNAHELVQRRKKQLAAKRITKVSDSGVALIKRFEGFVDHPYRDAVGVWTIGYGHTSGVGPNSKNITEKQATALLKTDLNHKYAPPVAALHLPLSQHQFDALVSFVYNCGPGAIDRDTGVGRALRSHDWKGAANHLLDWDMAGSRVLPGLTSRREAERKLFLS